MLTQSQGKTKALQECALGRIVARDVWMVKVRTVEGEDELVMILKFRGGAFFLGKISFLQCWSCGDFAEIVNISFLLLHAASAWCHSLAVLLS